MTLKDNTISYCFFLFFLTVYVWRTLPPSNFRQCSGNLIFLSEQLVYSVTEKINISEVALFRKYVTIKHLGLNVFSKTS